MRGKLALAVGVLALAACQLIAGITDREVGSPPDSGTVVLPDAAPDAAPSCPKTRWPPPPQAPDDTTNITFVDAIRSFDFGVAEIAGIVPAVGFDLDCITTCPGASSCVPHLDTTPQELCDDPPAGEDNGLGKLLTSAAPLVSGNPQDYSVNARVAQGELGVLIKVFGYNGKPDDPNVEVAAYVSNGIWGAGDAGPIAPRWDGNDAWTIDPNSILNPGAPSEDQIPTFLDTHAYVAGGVLVSIIGALNVPVVFGAGAETFELAGGVITATIATDATGQPYLQSGQIGARISTRSILTALVNFRDPLTDGGHHLCGSDPTYKIFKQTFICTSADINAESQDNLGAPCDAMSVAIGFAASPARIGAVRGRTDLVSTCDDASVTWTDDCPADYDE
jgi:hypothetical protein